GEIADGVILWLCPPAYVRDVALPALERGRRRAGKPLTGFEIVAAVPLAVTDDRPAAMAAFRAELTRYVEQPFYRAMLQAEGVGASRHENNYVSLLHARLRAIYHNARLQNLGVGGATSADVLARQLEPAIASRPDLVTLSVGPNDITEGVPLAAYTRNMDAILARLAATTPAVIVVSLLPDLAVTPRFRGHEAEALVGRRSVEFNDALARVAKRHGAQIVDLYAPSRREVPARP